MNEENKPLVISIVSGKGGVGKTRIAMTLAKILSNNLNVLLIDFDIHNQGLTHLLYSGNTINKTTYSVVDYLTEKLYLNANELHKNLYFIPSSNQFSQEKIENLNNKYNSKQFSDLLLKLIEDSKTLYSIDCVIIDNTGIPDDFSIGSSIAADKVLLITQTDSVTWRGALNFHRIFLNNGGDPTNIKFIVNNIPEKYSYDLVNFEANKIGDFFKNLNFELFIPFEYGIFESFDSNPFDDENIEMSLFYKKIKLLSVILLKEANLKQFISDDLKQIYNNLDEITKSLDVKYDKSITETNIKKSRMIKGLKIFVALYFAVSGVIFASITHPDIIPVFIKELDYIMITSLMMLIVSFVVLIMPQKRFLKIISLFSSKRNRLR